MKDPETGEWRSSVWDALAGYGYWDYVEPEPHWVPEEQGQGRWLLEDDDFSSEHGYEPGVGGRTEFRYGEFDRWV
jgi:hypothetical protein